MKYDVSPPAILKFQGLRLRCFSFLPSYFLRAKHHIVLHPSSFQHTVSLSYTHSALLFFSISFPFFTLIFSYCCIVVMLHCCIVALSEPYPLSIINYPLSIINYQLSIINYQLLIVNFFQCLRSVFSIHPSRRQRDTTILSERSEQKPRFRARRSSIVNVGGNWSNTE